ncbi:succinate--CoA ligase subunit beta [Dethiosulfatarculus sandiegensis]|uniref:Succinyl-CoA synthetase subunit beta n=1 Tax=Dethiosulfatarculus sandiegensis TaxID=1429043 RepID=A0A0D2JAF3_9BACT|nr:succinate--CoA ligase subunit beta [Dethiosulfatarculus sandiegensis]KIX15114.1 succinyl-CoA synthetase subunit beta [Dethiosulfatarculus sandiegensis]
MKLLEFQAKKIMAQNGIPIPSSQLVEGVSDLEGLSYPVVLKAQIPVGGRGKAGAVHLVNGLDEARSVTEALLDNEVKGYRIKTLLAEEAVDIKQEIYLCCLNDKEANRPMLVASREGGVDIEQLAKESPHKILHKRIDPLVGLMDYDIQGLAAGLGIPADAEFKKVVRGLWNILRNQDATLVEINPLAITNQGPCALDGKIILDDNAAYRFKEQRQKLKEEQSDRIVQERSNAEELADKYEISYVLLDGDIGIIADGAGTGMLTLDLVKDLGGKPANFCEMGGKAAAEAAEQAMEIVMANTGVKSLLISLIGGLTRMDQVAEGIDAYLKKNPSQVPVSVRMCGTKAEEGIQILAAHGIKAQADLFETARQAVQVVR